MISLVFSSNHVNDTKLNQNCFRLELYKPYDSFLSYVFLFDPQMVFVSLGAPRRERKGEGVQLPASCLPPPQKEHIPMLLLLQEPHLTTLFDLLEMLACFKPPSPNTEKVHESPDAGVNTVSMHDIFLYEIAYSY